MSEPTPEPVVTVFLTNAVRTLVGPGPGVKVLPASEAGALIGMKYAVYGDRPPGLPDPEPAPTRRYPRAGRRSPTRRIT